MHIETLRKKLLAVARADSPPRDDVPYAFEKRVMARIRAQVPGDADPWALWGRLLWRAAAPCVALMLLVSVWAFVSSNKQGTSADSLARDLETAVFAPLGSLDDNW